VGHRHNDDLGLAYHQVIARRLLADASIIDRARARVEQWTQAGQVHQDYIDAWRAVLRGCERDVAAVLVDDSDHAAALRQVSPFAGVLTPRERWSIWRSRRRPTTAGYEGASRHPDEAS
jgi:hypothetical protein